MPIAYSYKRFSSDAQEGNDSIRRQTAAASRYIEENPELGLVLDTTLSLTDAGVSAYKGKNLSKAGALGMFMEAVRDGLIQPGSWLLLESLDRFTRQSPRIAAFELLDLINRGIVVVTLHNGTVYRADDFSDSGMDGVVSLIGALIAMQGNFQEQVTKGKRVAAAWKNNYSKVAAGGHVVTKTAPFWLSVNSERTGFNVLEDKAAIVREIYERRASGEGKTKIANDLTARGVPTSKGRGEGIWHASAVAKLLDSDTPSGVLVNKHGDRFEGYYPSIVEPALFQQVRALRQQAPVQGKTTTSHILTGLIKHECGTTMRRVNKGVRTSGIKLQCPKCLNALPFVEAVNLVSQALFESQWVKAASDAGAETLLQEQNIDGLALEVEEAYLHWRRVKTLEAKNLYERITRDLTEARAVLRELKGTNTEVLALMEEQALTRASKGAGGIISALGSVVTSASFNHDCSELKVQTISGKNMGIFR
jgi:DNA invertase Pin-like site-specific DNA recombinase